LTLHGSHTSKAIKNACNRCGKGKAGSKKAEGGKYQELASKVKTEKKMAGLLLTAGVAGFLTA
jgi:hypothetical protein